MVEMKSDSIEEDAMPTIQDEQRFPYFFEYLAGREVWLIERACMLLLDMVSFRRFTVHQWWKTDSKVPPEHRYVRMLMDAVRQYELTEGKSGIKSIDTEDGVAILPQVFIDYAVLKRIDKHMPDYMKSRDDSPIPRPPPDKNTTAKVWHTDDGAFHISTKTDEKTDGQATFKMKSYEPTLQMSLIRLLSLKHPKGVAVRELIQELYPDQQVVAENVENIIKKTFGVISAVRQKLKDAGINPEILPVSSRGGIDTTTEVKLNLAKVHNQGALKRLHPANDLGVLKKKSKSIETPLSFDMQTKDDGRTLRDSHKGGDLREEIEDI